MRSYLVDCMQKQVPASFDGYESYVQEAINSNQQLTFSAKATKIALEGLSMVGNMLIGFAISKGIEMAVTAVDNWIHRVDNANQAMEDAISEYDSAKSSLESLNSELDTQKKELDALLAKDKLTYAEKGQLEKLQAITKELLIQQEIAERQAEKASREAAISTVKSYETQYGKYDVSEENLATKLDYAKYGHSPTYEKDDITGNLATYIHAQDQLANIQRNYEKALSTGNKPSWTSESVQYYYDMKQKYEAAVTDIISNLQDKRLALEEEYQKALEKKRSGAMLASDDRNIISTYESIYNSLRMIYKYMDQDAWNDMEFLNIFSTGGIEKTKRELIEMAKAGELTSETIKEFPNLNQALNNSGLLLQDGQKTAADALYGEITAFAEAEMERERLPFAERFQNLWDSEALDGTREDLIKLAEQSGITAEDIQSLAEENDSLAALLEDSGMSAQFAASCFSKVCSGADGFSAITDDARALDQVLHEMDDSLQKVNASKSQYDKAMQEDDYNAEFNNYQEAYARAMEMFESGEYGKHFRSTMEYLLGDASYTMSMEDMYAAMEDLKSIFGENSENGLGFLDQLYSQKEILDGLDSSLEKLENGSYAFSLDPEEFKIIAEALGMTTEEVAACVNALGMFGDYSAYDTEELQRTLQSFSIAAKDGESSVLSLQSVEQMLSDLGKNGYEAYHIMQDIQGMEGIRLLDFSTGDAETLQSIVSQLEELGTLEIDENGVNVDALITNLRDAFGMAYEDIGTFIANLQNENSSFTGADGLALDFQTDQNIWDMITQLKDSEAAASVHEVNTELESADDWVNTLSWNLDILNGKPLGTLTSQIGYVTEQLISAVSNGQALSGILDELNQKPVPSVTPSDQTSDNSSTISSGLANPKFIQTFLPHGMASASGRIGVPRDEVSLINELGHETIVDPKTGTYEVVQGGAQFRKLKKGQIILNHLQTKALLKNGKIPSFGKMLFQGNIPLKGNAYAKGTAGEKSGSNNTGTQASSGGGTYSGTSSSSGSGTSSETAERDTTKTFDWIEVIISRMERLIKNFGNTVSAAYRRWETRNDALASQIARVTENISLQQQAYDAYMAKAESVGLSDYYKGLVQNGAVSLEDISDENLQEQIRQYQEYYEKALAYSDAVQELTDNLADLAKKKFDQISRQFDAQMTLIDHQISMVKGYADQAREQGYVDSINYYDMLIQTELGNIEKLKAEHTALSASLQEALNSGAIEAYSEDWFDMVGSINDAEEAIQDANSALIDYRNTMRQISWDMFDLAQDYISKITDESDFLIDLISTNDMHNDNGTMNGYAQAAVGLHAVNYNTYLQQADDYAREMEAVSKSLARDPYNTELIKRRQELLKLQQDSIKAAHDERKAIKDLVSDSYDAMLDYLKDLIDRRREVLRAEKDLYDYQRTIQDKTETIGSYQKQLAAYAGDTSEEAQTRIQQIKVSLEEAQQDLADTEYDQWLNDQERLMDDLYSEYETLLNQRLDDLDGLIQDMIDQTNENAAGIRDTITAAASEAGYTLTNEMRTIWDTSNGIGKVVTDYASNFGNVMTGVQASINEIKGLLAQMAAKANAEAAANINSVAQSAASVPTTSTAPAPAPAPAAPSSPAPSGGGSSWGSWFVYKKDSYPKSKLYTNTSIVDRLKYHDIDSDFTIRKTYYEAMGGSGTYRGTAAQNTWMIDQMKAHGYRSGSQYVPYNQLAWTQEDGGEAIFRASDGALLTPLGRGDKVFTKDMTDNLWKLAQANLNIPLALPKTPQYIAPDRGVRDISLTIDGIQMYGVNDPEQFTQNLKKTLQNDSTIEKIVQSIAFDSALGRNSLTKKRY